MAFVLMGLASVSFGRGSPARYFYIILIVSPDYPSQRPCTHLSLKCSMIALYTKTGKTTGYDKCHSLPLPFLAFVMGYKSAAARKQETAGRRVLPPA